MQKAPLIPSVKFENSALPFKIQRIKWLMQEQGDVNASPHSHDHYEMIWITNGAGSVYADSQDRVIGENLLYCVKPGKVHRLQVNKDAEGFILSFTDSFLNLADLEFDWTCKTSLFHFFSKCQAMSVQNGLVADINAIVMKMAKEFEGQYSFRTHLLRRYFKLFLIYLVRQLEVSFQSAGQTGEIKLVKCFMELLDKNFKEKKMVAEYASQLSVTPNYLNEIVRKNTGFSTGYHIRQRVALEARRMGWYSGASMKEIAYSLGFSHTSHFSKFFKAVSGVNFSDFKKENPCYPLFSQQSLTA